MLEFQYFFQGVQGSYVQVRNNKKIEVTKKAKLAILAGFETEKKTEEKFQRTLWLHVAKSIL